METESRPNERIELDGIFLDFYGTLAAGDRRAVESICQAIIDDHGLTGSCGELALQWGRRYFEAIECDGVRPFRSLRQIEHDTLMETCGGLVGEFCADKYIQRFNEYMAAPPLFPEVQEVLSRLALPTCIVSNADEYEIRAAIATHGLHFDHIVTSESARSYKPQRRIFQRALDLTGWSPGRVLHVGDSLHSDVAGAKQLNIRTAWVRREERITDIGSAEADFTWPDLLPLLRIA